MSTPVLDGEINEVDQAPEYRYSLKYGPTDTHLDPAICITAIYITYTYTEIFWKKLKSLKEVNSFNLFIVLCLLHEEEV